MGPAMKEERSMVQECRRGQISALVVASVTAGFAAISAVPASAGQSLGSSARFHGSMPSHFEIARPFVAPHPSPASGTGGIIPPIAPGPMDQGFIPPLVSPGASQDNRVSFPHRHKFIPHHHGFLAGPIFVIDPADQTSETNEAAPAPAAEAAAPPRKIVGETGPFDAHVVEVPDQDTSRDQGGGAQVMVIRPGLPDQNVTVPSETDAGAMSGPQN